MIHLQRHVGKSTMYEFKKKVSQAMERLEKSFVQINVFLSSLFMVANRQISNRIFSEDRQLFSGPFWVWDGVFWSQVTCSMFGSSVFTVFGQYLTNQSAKSHFFACVGPFLLLSHQTSPHTQLRVRFSRWPSTWQSSTSSPIHSVLMIGCLEY